MHKLIVCLYSCKFLLLFNLVLFNKLSNSGFLSITQFISHHPLCIRNWHLCCNWLGLHTSTLVGFLLKTTINCKLKIWSSSVLHFYCGLGFVCVEVFLQFGHCSCWGATGIWFFPFGSLLGFCALDSHLRISKSSLYSCTIVLQQL